MTCAPASPIAFNLPPMDADYLKVLKGAFGGVVDHASLIRLYGPTVDASGCYSPPSASAPRRWRTTSTRSRRTSRSTTSAMSIRRCACRCYGSGDYRPPVVAGGCPGQDGGDGRGAGEARAVRAIDSIAVVALIRTLPATALRPLSIEPEREEYDREKSEYA